MKVVKLTSDNFNNALRNLMKMSGVPPRTMFSIRGVGKVISDEIEKYNAIRSQLIEECSEKDSNGNTVRIGADSIKIDPKKSKELNIKLKELNEIETKLPEIKFSDLGDNPSLNSEDLYNLEFIIE